MNKKVSVRSRWYGPVPHRHGEPLPTNQWARVGRKRKWSVRWYAPDGKRPRQTFDSRAEAEAFAREKAAEFESRGPQARYRPRRVTLGMFAPEFKTLRTGPRGQRLSIRTLREYQAVLERFAAFVGPDTPLESLTMVDATRYLAHLRNTPSRRGKDLSTASINKHKISLKVVLNVAVRQLRYLNHNPFSGLRQDRVAEQAIRYISPVEFNLLTEACRALRTRALWWEAFLTVGYTAATRANEAVHLTWSDVDFEEDSIRIIAKPETSGLEAWRPKDYDARRVPVPRHTIDLLAELHAGAPEGSEFAFVTPKRAAWIKAKRDAGTWKEDQAVINNLTRDFKAIVRSAGIRDATLHDLRRSCITHWAGKLPAAVVRDLAGHADIRTTLKYYVSIRDEDLNQAREITANALLLDLKSTQIAVCEAK